MSVAHAVEFGPNSVGEIRLNHVKLYILHKKRNSLAGTESGAINLPFWADVKLP